MRSTVGSSHTTADHPVSSRKWLILLAVGLCLFLGSVDGSIVNVALPTLMKDFETDFATIQWVVLSYLLGLTILMVGMGRLADIIGKKRVFTTGIVLFLAASALCGLAPSVYWLIAFRFLQSIGAAMMLGLGVAILTETWPAHERGKAIGFSAGFISMGIVLGPTIGGFLLEYLSWHWIFYVNVPVGALSLLLSLLYLPPMRGSGPRERFDFFGAIVLAAGLLCFTLTMTMGQQVGFLAAPTLALLVAGVLALPLFIWRERRAPYPMVDLNLFRIPQFSLNLFTATLTFVAISGIVLLLPFYLELVMQLNLRDVGLMMAIVPLVMVALQPLSGTLSDRLGTRPVSMVGLAFIFCGYLAMATLPVGGTPLGFSLRMLPVSIGMATFNSPNNSAIMGAVPRQRLGVASGLLGMMRTLGQVTGIAVLGAFFTSRVATYAGVNGSLRQVPPSAIVAALHDQFLLVAGLILVGIVVAGFTWWWEIKTKRQARRVEMQLPAVE